MDNQILITQLKKYRQQKGITQLELAQQVGKSHQYINELETGKRSLSRIAAATLQQIARALNTKMDNLLEEDIVMTRFFIEGTQKYIDIDTMELENGVTDFDKFEVLHEQEMRSGGHYIGSTFVIKFKDEAVYRVMEYHKNNLSYTGASGICDYPVVFKSLQEVKDFIQK